MYMRIALPLLLVEMQEGLVCDVIYVIPGIEELVQLSMGR